jgi:hypothetical protein
MDLLSQLDSNVLVKLLIDELSEEFLITYFFAYSEHYTLLVFPNIRSLCASGQEIPLIQIFENFKKFLLKSFVSKKGCCPNSEKEPSNSSDLSANENFLEKCGIAFDLFIEKFKDILFCRPAKPPVEVNYDDFLSSRGFPANFKLLKNLEFLWKNRLERLAKRLLTVDEFNKIAKQIKKTFDFLNSFFKFGLEFLLIKEYKRLFYEIHGAGMKNPPALGNFLFLVEHFVQHLNDSDCIVAWLEILSSQSPEFIICLCFIYDKGRESRRFRRIGKTDSQKYKHLFSRNLFKMHKSVEEFIKPINGGFYVFNNVVKVPDGIYFANKIQQKTKDFISKELKRLSEWMSILEEYRIFKAKQF